MEMTGLLDALWAAFLSRAEGTKMFLQQPLSRIMVGFRALSDPEKDLGWNKE